MNNVGWIFLLSLVVVLWVLVIGLRKQNKRTGRRRIKKITFVSGISRYRCEEEFEDGSWEVMSDSYFSGPNGEFLSQQPAEFGSEKEAFKFLGEHHDADPDFIVKEKVIIYESEKKNK